MREICGMQAKEAGHFRQSGARKIMRPFPKNTATKLEWLVTRQKAKKEGYLVHLTNRNKESQSKIGYKSIKKFFKTKK